jgi:hypothetical protein
MCTNSEHDSSSWQASGSHDQLLPSNSLSNMPPYRRAKTQINSFLTIDWTLSESPFDFNGGWIIIDDVEVGHAHFHLNTTMGRIQVWILERKAWEEYIFRQAVTRERDDWGDDMGGVFQNLNLISVIVHAKSSQ